MKYFSVILATSVLCLYNCNETNIKLQNKPTTQNKIAVDSSHTVIDLSTAVDSSYMVKNLRTINLKKNELHTTKFEQTETLKQIENTNIFVNHFYLTYPQSNDPFEIKKQDAKYSYPKTEVIVGQKKFFITEYFSTSHNGALQLPPFNYVMRPPTLHQFKGEAFIDLSFTHTYDGAEGHPEGVTFLCQYRNNNWVFISVIPKEANLSLISDFNNDSEVDFLSYSTEADRLDFYILKKGKFVLDKSHFISLNDTIKSNWFNDNPEEIISIHNRIK